MERKVTKINLCIDISNLVPGKGSSGGGIVTYALNLIKSINNLNFENELEIICIKHPDFKGLEMCTHIKFLNRSVKRGIFHRLYWTNIYLPVFCLRKKVDILHKVTPELPIIKVCKYVCTLHDLMFAFYNSNRDLRSYLSTSEKIKFFLFETITKITLNRSSITIVPSQAIKNEVINKYKISDKKIVVTHEATEKKTAEEDYSSKINSDTINIGVIAALHPHKGHLAVLEIADLFIKSGFTSFKISFRGGVTFQNYFKKLQEQIEISGLKNHVFFQQFDPGIKLSQIYSEFDAIMLLSEYEGFGLPVLEAQAHNIPVLCSDIPVFKEILGDSAFYISKNQNIGSIKNIITVLTDRNRLEHYSKKGALNVKNFSWDKMAMETLAVYKQLVHLKK